MHSNYREKHSSHFFPRRRDRTLCYGEHDENLKERPRQYDQLRDAEIRIRKKIKYISVAMCESNSMILFLRKMSFIFDVT